MRLWHNQPGSNGYAWDGKGPGFESDLDLFIFLNRNHSVAEKLSTYHLSAYVLSAILRNSKISCRMFSSVVFIVVAFVFFHLLL